MIHVLCFLFHFYYSPPSLFQVPVCPAPALPVCTCSLIVSPHLCCITPLISLYLFPPPPCRSCRQFIVCLTLLKRSAWVFGPTNPARGTVLTMNRLLSCSAASYQQLNAVVLGSTTWWAPTAGEHTTPYIWQSSQSAFLKMVASWLYSMGPHVHRISEHLCDVVGQRRLNRRLRQICCW